MFEAANRRRLIAESPDIFLISSQSTMPASKPTLVDIPAEVLEDILLYAYAAAGESFTERHRALHTRTGVEATCRLLRAISLPLPWTGIGGKVFPSSLMSAVAPAPHPDLAEPTLGATAKFVERLFVPAPARLRSFDEFDIKWPASAKVFAELLRAIHSAKARNGLARLRELSLVAAHPTILPVFRRRWAVEKLSLMFVDIQGAWTSAQLAVFLFSIMPQLETLEFFFYSCDDAEMADAYFDTVLDILKGENHRKLKKVLIGQRQAGHCWWVVQAFGPLMRSLLLRSAVFSPFFAGCW